MACALAVAALIYTTQIELSSPPAGPVRFAPIAAAAAIGWLVGSAGAGGRWSARAVVAAVLAGAGGTLIGWLWHLVSGSFGPLRATDAASVLDLGFAMLPALASSAAVGRPGAATLGAMTQLLLATSTGLPGASTYPAFALLQLPIVLLPAEAYAAGATWTGRAARAHRTRAGGAFVGLLLGLGSAAASWLLVPGMQVRATAEALVSGFVGAAMGWLVVAAMQRAGAFGWPAIPDLDGPPGSEGLGGAGVGAAAWGGAQEGGRPQGGGGRWFGRRSVPGKDDRRSDEPRIIRRREPR